MASDKQIEANRRNARNSTGPRSAAAKQRASRNAYSHGLSRPLFGPEVAQAVEALASRILRDHGKTGDRQALVSARRIAEAELELARVQRIKLALIERAATCALDPLSPMPEQEPARTAEAVRRALPDLVRLTRYERRAAGRRDRAIRLLTQCED